MNHTVTPQETAIVQTPRKDGDYWYAHRHELQEGQVFRSFDGFYVKLYRRVPGDGTKWYVADWCGYWSHEDGTIEPGDLRGDPIENFTGAQP